jgi:putative polymerase
MSAIWSPSEVSTSNPADAQGIEHTLAPVVILAAVVFNFVLCFVDTNLFRIGASAVISTEIVLIGMAFGLIWHRSVTLYDILLLVTAYFFVVMVFRANFDPKILHDLLIPIAFFFVGC